MALNNLSPEYLSSKWLVPRKTTINYNLRGSSTKLTLTQPRTNYGKKAFRYSGAKLWNSIPEDIRKTATLKTFKISFRILTLLKQITIIIIISIIMTY